MKFDIAKTLQKKKKQLLEQWMNNQLAHESLREDLMSNEDLKLQSIELIDAFVKAANDRNIGDAQSSDFEPVLEILSGISISRARQALNAGFHSSLITAREAKPAPTAKHKGE